MVETKTVWPLWKYSCRSEFVGSTDRYVCHFCYEPDCVTDRQAVADIHTEKQLIYVKRVRLEHTPIPICSKHFGKLFTGNGYHPKGLHSTWKWKNGSQGDKCALRPSDILGNSFYKAIQTETELCLPWRQQAFLAYRIFIVRDHSMARHSTALEDWERVTTYSSAHHKAR